METVLCSHPAIHQIAILAVPDEKTGEEIFACDSVARRTHSVFIFFESHLSTLPSISCAVRLSARLLERVVALTL
ncbi:hypothetical protein I6F35_13535 [Bradyrhizobium sp. BRP22]|nr:hypothetical protein [Bradyrhizobium sp. BRP22]